MFIQGLNKIINKAATYSFLLVESAKVPRHSFSPGAKGLGTFLRRFVLNLAIIFWVCWAGSWVVGQAGRDPEMSG